MNTEKLQKLSIGASLGVILLTALIIGINSLIYQLLGGSDSTNPFLIFGGFVLYGLVILDLLMLIFAPFSFILITFQKIKSGGWNRTYLLNALLTLIPLFLLFAFIRLWIWFWEFFEATI